MTPADRNALEWLRVPSNWAAIFADMPALAFGIHMRLMLLSALRGPLPATHAALARLAGVTTRELVRWWSVIAEYWTEGEGHLTCPHVEAERARMQEGREALREAGRRGAERRWQSRSDGTPSSRPIGKANDVAISSPMALDGELEKEIEVEVERDSEVEVERTGASLRPAIEPSVRSQDHARARRRRLLRALDEKQAIRIAQRREIGEVPQ